MSEKPPRVPRKNKRSGQGMHTSKNVVHEEKDEHYEYIFIRPTSYSESVLACMQRMKSIFSA